MEDPLFIGVDVGTGSVRGALISKNGEIFKTAVKTINLYNPLADFYQQSSNEIWEACCFVIKEVANGTSPDNIKGIGFDATCSLVVLDVKGNPLSVSPNNEVEQNIIVWLDHRANEEADFINNTRHKCLNQVGGRISLEMQVPKLLWLKKNLYKECWLKIGKVFDLPDFLTWKATDSDSRSLCSVVCKWMYESSPEGGRWNKEFLNIVGLGDLNEQDYQKIGNKILAPGDPCGAGLSKRAAKEMNLLPGTAIATSIIDAHAGGLGLIGIKQDNISQFFNTRISLICGTSTCHMVVNEENLFVQGVWGPYYGAMIPNMWLNEAGQSATGKLIDHIIDTHPATVKIKDKIDSNILIVDYLNNYIENLANKRSIILDQLTSEVHMLPDFHGNRSPLADHTLRGMICGLDLNCGEEQLAILYLAALQALAYGTRHIIETLQEEGYKEFQSILLCGGLSKNKLFVRTLSNIASKVVLIPQEAESVLLGSAMLAATAAKIYPDLKSAVLNMAGGANIVMPTPNIYQYHNKKYLIFKKMLQDQLEYRKIMGCT